MTYQHHHRYRLTQELRDLFQETSLSVNDVILPIFIHESLTQKKPILSLPGFDQWSLNDVKDEITTAQSLGIKAIILFGIPTIKNETGSQADNDNGIIQKAIRHIKSIAPDMIVIADTCLCEYTSHGHCGIQVNGHLDNNATLNRLASVAISYAKAGADIIAPSGMMDGMVNAIRTALDSANYHHISIMSYSVKYASAFYGPFRDAAGSGDHFKGNRKHHQMNITQSREALLEASADSAEGADILMVKPAGAYLDIIFQLRQSYNLPIAAYQVSGEYAMLKNAAAQGIIDNDQAMIESLTAIKRAGADLIITYFAKELAHKMSLM